MCCARITAVSFSLLIPPGKHSEQLIETLKAPAGIFLVLDLESINLSGMIWDDRVIVYDI